VVPGGGVALGRGEGGGGTTVAVRVGFGLGVERVAGAEGDPAEVPDAGPPDRDTDGDTDVDGAGAAPDGPESPPPSATMPTTSNTTPSNATSAPTNRAPPGAASVDRSRSTDLPPDDDPAVDVGAVRSSSSGRSPEPPVRSSNE
jgi:hypothetical protein